MFGRGTRFLALVSILGFVGLDLAPLRSDDAQGETRRGEPFVQYAPLPEAVASFGACVSDNWLYVYSGHTGRAHQHSIDNLSKGFQRLNLLDRQNWELLPSAPPLQSPSLVQYKGGIYRVGGLSARNRRGEKDDLHSVADFARFDPQTRAWEDLPSLPEPRSSHDTVRLGDHLFVVGGWNLQGEENTWYSSAYKIDLSAEQLKWEEIAKAPFERRALAAAAVDGKVYAIGGMTSAHKLSREVDVFDPKTGEWSKGPSLARNGFGISAFTTGGELYASGMDGMVRRLDRDAGSWEDVDTLMFPRFFHRLVPVSDKKLLAVGGAGGGAHLRIIEEVQLGSPASGVQVASWTLPYPGKAKNRQGAFLWRNALYVFGGNNSLGQHDFEPENFVQEAFRINLATLQIRPLPAFPVGRQSMQSVLYWQRSGHRSGHGFRGESPVPFVVGGFGHDGKVARTHADIFTFNLKSKEWQKRQAALPTPRSQSGLLFRDKVLWLFGGLDYNPAREGEATFHHPLEILKWDTGDEESAVVAAEISLPRPRRAFGGAAIGEKYYLIGGMRERFQLVTDCDVYDFEKKSWDTISSPSRPRISPELVALDGKLYLAGGSSPKAESGFERNSTLEVYDPEAGKWSVVLDELPVPPGHLRMFAFRDRLLLYSAHTEEVNAIRLAIIDPRRAAGGRKVASRSF